MTFFLTIEQNRIFIYEGEKSRRVTSVADLNGFLAGKADEAGVSLGDLRVMCSSTLEFPREFTKNEATVRLARELCK